MNAKYIGKTEYYDKNYDYHPIIIQKDCCYDIVIKDGTIYDHVMIVENGHVRTSIPYTKGNIEKYWQFV